MRKLTVFVSFLMLFIAVARQAETSAETGYYDLAVTFDLPASSLSGLARFQVKAGETVILDVSGLFVSGVDFDNAAADYSLKDGRMSFTADRQGELSIRYEAFFKSGPPGHNQERTRNIIGPRGIALIEAWYPEIGGLARYRLRAVLPKGYEALSGADTVVRTAQGNNITFEFRFDHPTPGITLVASDRYQAVTDRLDGTRLSAYFFPGDRKKAGKYLSQAKNMLKMYEKLLGRYPWKRFTIAEHFLDVDCSIPSMTLLAQGTFRNPEAAESALSRAVLSQWLGNSVFVDGKTGDWTDGLITYLSGHSRAEATGDDWKYRKQLLLEYEAFVNPETETSLREYSEDGSRGARAVGRGKGALVFHMLKRTTGESGFIDAVRLFIEENRYRRASWDDIRAAFEKKSGKDLSLFFHQWVDRKGLPELALGRPTVVRTGASFETAFELVQKGSVYTMGIPVRITSPYADGSVHEVMHVDAEKEEIRIRTDREPRTLVVDGEYETPRRLTAAESPPIIAGLLGGGKFLIASPASGKERYAGVISKLADWGGEVKEPQTIADESISKSSVAVLGSDNPLIGRLFGYVRPEETGCSITVRKNPWNEDKVIVLIDARSGAEADAGFGKLLEYANFSRLRFRNGACISKEIDEAGRGIAMELKKPATAIDLSALRTLNDVIGAAADKRIVYIGEYHDRHAHHAVQLEMIRGLYEKNPKLAIGMEMFQRPFQKVIDDYIGGSIAEREFLERTEYFKRWIFDYNLYKPIIDFSRERKIPVVALNQKKEIVEKVSKTGLDSLTDEERAAVPGQMDFSDGEYRKRLKDVFEQHKGAGEKNFDFFYQAQVLWDETMAETADRFLRENPDRSLVVIAGGGHLAFGSGIPKRSFRRNGLPYSIVLNDGEVDKDIADYLVVPGELEGVEAPRLMAVLSAGDGIVSVAGLPDDSVSQKAGIRVGDVLLTLDGETVQSVEDIRLLLFYKKKGETLKVRVRRKRFFFADKIMQFEVQL